MSPDAPPTLLAQISDSHIDVSDGSGDALAAAVAAVSRLDPQPAAVLCTGDLTNNGTPEEYALARELLAPLRAPLHPIPGNHDDRDAMRAAFADHPGVAGTGEYIQYSAGCGPLRVIACDTQKPNSDGGELPAERLEWIEAELAREPGRPTIVAMHHPPILTGMSEFDEEIGLAPEERRALADAIARAGGADLIVTGHIHLAIRGSLGPTPVQICPSTYLQAKLDFRPGAPIKLIPETPAFAVHVCGADSRVISHVRTIESPAR